MSDIEECQLKVTSLQIHLAKIQKESFQIKIIHFFIQFSALKIRLLKNYGNQIKFVIKFNQNFIFRVTVSKNIKEFKDKKFLIRYLFTGSIFIHETSQSELRSYFCGSICSELKHLNSWASGGGSKGLLYSLAGQK
jgi:hypothetical protein